MNETDLSEEKLRELYLERGWTEAEIAKAYGTYQVKVNRLRKQFGIETLSKSGRLDLPDLTPRQRSLLVGSMLGDGRLFQTGPRTAAYSEYHSIKQAAYLDWKASEWGSYVQSIRDVSKKVGVDTYVGRVLRLHGCTQFTPYWRRYYPTGSGNKTFTNVSRNITALSLATWYLDDGSKTANGYVRFAVSPVKEDQEALLEILRNFGLTPNLHINRDGSDPAIWIHDRTSITKFLNLVAPHVPECMAYKLDILNRKRGVAPRHLLTQSLLQGFVNQGWGSSRISEALGVSVGAVRRALDRHGFDRPEKGRPQNIAEGLSIEEAKTVISATDLSEEALVEILVRVPHPPLPSEEVARKDWQALVSARVTLGDPVGNQGLKVCSRCFPHRLDARYESLPSLRVAWFDPKWVRRAVRFQRKVGDPVLPMNVHRALRAVLRTPTNFRPLLAKAVVEAYTSVGDLVLDPCAGYGGRAAGTLAAGRRYVGVDPHPKAYEAFQRLAEYTGTFVVHDQPYEALELEEGFTADLIFTSPPYFSKERYSDEISQSWVAYPTWSGWLKGFLVPFVSKSWSWLKPGGAFVVNTKNIRIGRDVYPIADELKTLAGRQGFELEAELAIRLGKLGKSPATEPLFVFRRPPG